MAGIRTSIKLINLVSGPARNIQSAVDACRVSFENMQRVSSNAVDTASMKSMTNHLSNTSSVADNLSDNIRNANMQQQNFNNSIRSGESAANGLLGKIKGFVGAYVGIQAGKGIIAASDQLAQTQARLNLINDKMQTTEQLQQMIFESAQRSRGSYMGTADAVAKLGMQARSAFSSNAEIVAFTEQLNKNFKIAGASAQGIDSVMLQLTQSMASGKLQGEELNSVLDHAQPIVQHIADYMKNEMGIDTSNMKELASEGMITADIIKKAMFYSADETNKAFEQIPMTFSDIATNVKNNAQKVFEPVLQKLNDLANNENINTLAFNVVNGMATVANATMTVMETMANMYAFMSENWGTIGPVIGLVAGAYLAFNTVALITNGILGAQALAHGIAQAAAMLHTTATFAETQAQWGLNAALLACPLTWIVIVIAAVIAAIVAWSVHTNGLKATWLMFTNILITSWELTKTTVVLLAVVVMNAWDNMCEGCKTAAVGIQNALGNMKANGLMIIQNFVNGAIDMINKLIETVNSIPGVSIDAIQHVTFGAEAMAQNQAEQNARNSDLASYKAQKDANKKARTDYLNNMISDFQSGLKERMAAIDAAKADHANGKDTNILDMFKDNTNYQDLLNAAEGASQGAGDAAKNTGAMKDALDIAEEDLKYMRDMAETEAINRFTTAEIKVDMKNNNTINNEMDLDGVVNHLGSVLEESLSEVAEGAIYE